MDMEKIKAFLSLSETESFTKSAEQLFISQPALSKQIQTLEQELNIPLFNRTKKATTLTMYGTYFRPYAAAIWENYAKALDHIKQITNSEEGNLYVGATHFIGVYLLSPHLAQFQQLFPNITMHATIDSSKTLLRKLERYELELAFLSDYVAIDEERFQRLPWMEDELKVAVGANHPFAGRTSITEEDLATDLFVTKEKYSSIYQFINSSRRHVVTEGKSLFIHDQEAIKQVISTGRGFALLSPKSVALEVAAGRIYLLDLEGYELKRNITIVREKNRHITPACKHLLELILNEQ